MHMVDIQYKMAPSCYVIIENRELAVENIRKRGTWFEDYCHQDQISLPCCVT